MNTGASAPGARRSRPSSGNRHRVPRRFALVPVLLAIVLAGAGLGSVVPAAAAPAPGTEGVVVDGFGGLHVVTYGATPTITSFNRVDYWRGWDIVRGVALRSADPTTCASFGGYTVDGYGGLHPFGINGKTPPSKPRDGPYWKGWDIARSVALVPVDPRNPDSPPAGGFVLDGYGGLQYFTIDATVPRPTITGAPYWPNWDIARGLIILTNPGGYNGGFVVDAWGGLHPFSIEAKAPEAVVPGSGSYWPNWSIVHGGTGLPGAAENGGLTLDGWGGLHPFTLGAGPPPDVSQVTISAYWPNWDIARGVSMKQKKACP